MNLSDVCASNCYFETKHVPKSKDEKQDDWSNKEELKKN